jgi:hypothetical protein
MSASLAVKAKNGANSSLLVTFSSLKKNRDRDSENTWHEGVSEKERDLILAIGGFLDGWDAATA